MCPLPPPGIELERPAFVSQQVTEAHRYYLDLAPDRGAPIAVVCGGWERMRADYAVERETFPYLCIEFVAEGAGTVRLGGMEHALGPGMAFAYSPDVPHRIGNDASRPMRKYYVDFVGREAKRLLHEGPLGRWEPVQISAPNEILGVFEALQRDAFAEGEAGPLLAAAHLRVLLLKITQKALPVRSAEPRAMATYERARRLMEEHYATLRTAEDCARACHMTPVHLSRVFQRFARVSPYRFLTRLKMNAAAELLLKPGMMVKEVGERLAYGSPFQFSRAFKRVYGIAPDHFIRRSSRR